MIILTLMQQYRDSKTYYPWDLPVWCAGIEPRFAASLLAIYRRNVPLMSYPLAPWPGSGKACSIISPELSGTPNKYVPPKRL